MTDSPRRRKSSQPTPEQLAQVQETLHSKLKANPNLRERLAAVNAHLADEAARKGLGRKSGRHELFRLRTAGDWPAFYDACLPHFRELLRRVIERNGGVVAVSMLVPEAMESLPISRPTCYRYVDALTTPHGPFSIFGRYLLLNSGYVPAEENDGFWLPDVDGAA